MKETLISFEVAKLAKEKGFDEMCEYSYEGGILSKTFKSWKNSEDDSEYAVCTQSLLQKWLREVHNIHIVIENNACGYYYALNKAEGGTNIMWSQIGDGPNDGGVWNTYEEVLEEGIKQGLLLINNKN